MSGADPTMERAKRVAAEAVRQSFADLPPAAMRPVNLTLPAFRAAQVGRVLMARARDLRRRARKQGYVPEAGTSEPGQGLMAASLRSWFGSTFFV